MKAIIHIVTPIEFNYAGVDLEGRVYDDFNHSVPPLYEYKYKANLKTLNHAVSSVNVMFGGAIKRAYIEPESKRIKKHTIFCDGGRAQVVL